MPVRPSAPPLRQIERFLYHMIVDRRVASVIRSLATGNIDNQERCKEDQPEMAPSLQ
jgi:hypothetical protein